LIYSALSLFSVKHKIKNIFFKRRFLNMRKMNKKAFTLIELLIVIAIIGILFIVLVSKVDFATDKAKATGVQTDFRSFQVAFEQVAKENAGFNTFGWDEGDNGANLAAKAAITIGTTTYKYYNAEKDKADGIRNSYDEGDMNLNGILDKAGENDATVDEVWTGRKVYTETWTGVWTLVKPGTTLAADGMDGDRIFALESAINKNLDPKLHITIDAKTGKITMANQARDPWKVEYVGQFLTNASKDSTTNVTNAKATGNDVEDSLDRGAIIMYSKGANGKLGCVEEVVNGEVIVTVLTSETAGSANTADNNVAGKDDYSISTIYTFKNGYGEVISATTGFSANQ
jgi:prepilin-type N-terminal cleavage/methylation domain-containing protein